VVATPIERGGGQEVAVTNDTGELGLLGLSSIDERETPDPNTTPRDRLADDRDRQADERDRDADERDRDAGEHDRQAEALERHVPPGAIELRERRARTVLRHQAAAERQRAALDRTAAAGDRVQARGDREIAAHERGDATEELLARGDAARYDASRAERGVSAPEQAPLQTAETSAVTAHRLLNSSAVVSMGITTLQAHWDGMLVPERVHLLQRMLTHAAVIDDRLKDLTRGRPSLGATTERS
jgi:hypothetical protein